MQVITISLTTLAFLVAGISLSLQAGPYSSWDKKSCRSNAKCRDSNLENPCASAICFAQTSARCVHNCATCSAIFHVDGYKVKCDCKGMRSVRCNSNPCKGAYCYSNRRAICRPSMCGYCHAEFYDEDRNPVNCLKHTCLVPNPPIDGKIVPLARELPRVYKEQRVRYSCNKGFGMIGEPIRTCLQSGRFTGSPPVCVAACEMPPAPKNGGVRSLGAPTPFIKQRVEFQCKFNYQMFGPRYLTCLGNGKYNLKPPRCLRHCSFPRRLPQFVGVLGAKQTVYEGTSITFTCAKGYWVNSEIGSRLESKCTDNGFQPSIPFCEPVYCRANSIGNGTLFPLSGRVRYDKTIKYSCNEGYYLDVDISPRCTENGTFNVSTIPRCKKILTCPQITEDETCAVIRCSSDEDCSEGKCCDATCGTFCSTTEECPISNQTFNCTNPDDNVCDQEMNCTEGKCCQGPCGSFCLTEIPPKKYCPLESDLELLCTEPACNETTCPLYLGYLCCIIDGCSTCIEGLDKDPRSTNIVCPAIVETSCNETFSNCTEGLDCDGTCCSDACGGFYCHIPMSVCPKDPDPFAICESDEQCTDESCSASGHLCCAISGCKKCHPDVDVNSIEEP